MKTIQHLIISIITILLLLITSCSKIDKAPSFPCALGNNSHPYAARYQRITDKLLQAGTPGLSITVISPEGTWASSGGKADLSSKVPLTPCHALRIGSMTKLFTAVTIMKLQEEGLIDIKDKINKYIPKHITNEIDNADEVTIEQLLNHNSGIKDYLGASTIIKILNLSIVKNSAEENLKIVYGQKADFKPGSDLLYCNSNYLLLGLVIKYASGKKAYEVVKEKIIKPLQMTNTYPGNEIPTHLTRGYYDTYDNGFMKDLTEIDNNAVGGEDMLDGGIISSSNDLAIFINALFSGQILSQQSLDQMREFNKVTQDLGDMNFIKRYGLGLMELETDQGKAWGHYGGVHCFNGITLYFPEQKVTVSIIANGMSHKIGKVLNGIQIYNDLFKD